MSKPYRFSTTTTITPSLYDPLDGYYESYEREKTATPKLKVTYSPSDRILVDSKPTNFWIKEKYNGCVLVQQILKGILHAQKWIREEKLLTGDDPAEVFFDADPFWAPSKSNKEK